jgi:hypothetical protein
MTRQPVELTEDRAPWVHLARKAIQAGLNGDWPRVNAAVQAIDILYPGSMPQVMLAWIDTAALNIGLTPELLEGIQRRGEPLRPVYLREDDGQLDTNADDVDPAVANAGRLITARLANDEATFVAVIRTVPGNAEWTQLVSRVLEACVFAILRARQGLPTWVHPANE